MDDVEKRRLIKEWDESGLSADAFASSLGLHPQTLRLWGRAIRGPLRRRSRPRPLPRSVELVEVTESDPSECCVEAPDRASSELRVEVEFGDGRRLVVAGALSADMIVALVTALEAVQAE